MSILNQIRHAIYGMYLTNSYGLRLKKVKSNDEKKALRVAYAHAQLDALSVKVKVENPDNIPKKGTFLLVSNHRSVIDPLIVEIALESSGIFGLWISKKELYNSPFSGFLYAMQGQYLSTENKVR